jgi:hypothetical protein
VDAIKINDQIASKERLANARREQKRKRIVWLKKVSEKNIGDELGGTLY